MAETMTVMGVASKIADTFRMTDDAWPTVFGASLIVLAQLWASTGSSCSTTAPDSVCCRDEPG